MLGTRLVPVPGNQSTIPHTYQWCCTDPEPKSRLFPDFVLGPRPVHHKNLEKFTKEHQELKTKHKISKFSLS
jgi:hypothetical protein